MKKMNDYQFPTEIFSQPQFHEELQGYERTKTSLIEAIKVLKEESLPTSLEDLRRYAAMNAEGWHDFIGCYYKRYIDTLGYVLKEEKERIAGLYQQLFERTRQTVEVIGNILSNAGLIIEEKDGKLLFDDEAYKEHLRKKHTTKVDADGMAEYFSLIVAIKKAMDKAHDFEKVKGLQGFSLGNKTYFLNPFNRSLLAETNLVKYFNENPDLSPDFFAEMMQQYFKVEK